MAAATGATADSRCADAMAAAAAAAAAAATAAAAAAAAEAGAAAAAAAAEAEAEEEKAKATAGSAAAVGTGLELVWSLPVAEAYGWLRCIHIGRMQLQALRQRNTLESSLGLLVRLLTRQPTPTLPAIYTVVEIVDVSGAVLTVRGAARYMPSAGLRVLSAGVGALQVEVGTCSDRPLEPLEMARALEAMREGALTPLTLLEAAQLRTRRSAHAVPGAALAHGAPPPEPLSSLPSLPTTSASAAATSSSGGLTKTKRNQVAGSALAQHGGAPKSKHTPSGDALVRLAVACGHSPLGMSRMPEPTRPTQPTPTMAAPIISRQSTQTDAEPAPSHCADPWRVDVDDRCPRELAEECQADEDDDWARKKAEAEADALLSSLPTPTPPAPADGSSLPPPPRPAFLTPPNLTGSLTDVALSIVKASGGTLLLSSVCTELYKLNPTAREVLKNGGGAKKWIGSVDGLAVVASGSTEWRVILQPKRDMPSAPMSNAAPGRPPPPTPPRAATAPPPPPPPPAHAGGPHSLVRSLGLPSLGILGMCADGRPRNGMQPFGMSQPSPSAPSPAAAAPSWVAGSKYGDRKCREGFACNKNWCGYAHPIGWPLQALHELHLSQMHPNQPPPPPPPPPPPQQQQQQQPPQQDHHQQQPPQQQHRPPPPPPQQQQQDQQQQQQPPQQQQRPPPPPQKRMAPSGMAPPGMPPPNTAYWKCPY